MKKSIFVNTGWTSGLTKQVSKRHLLAATFLVIFTEINFAQQLPEAKPYTLVKKASTDHRSPGDNKLEAMQLVGWGNSYGYGGFVDDKSVHFNNEAGHYFLCFRNSVQYFNERGDLIKNRRYPASEQPQIVSKSGKYIVISNRETRETRMEIFDGTVVWRREIPRLVMGNIKTRPGKITDDGNLILEIGYYHRDDSGGAAHKTLFIDTSGAATELGGVRADELMRPGMSQGGISDSGKYYVSIHRERLAKGLTRKPKCRRSVRPGNRKGNVEPYLCKFFGSISVC